VRPAERAGSVGAREVREALARLRRAGEALRHLPAPERIERVGAVLERWRDPRAPLRRALEAELPKATGFSPEVVREGLTRALSSFDAAALRALVARELGAGLVGGRRRATSFDVTAVILAGALPTPSLLALLMPLVLGSPVLAKPSSSDPVTPGLVAASLAEVDPALGACVELARFAGGDDTATAALLEADCVVASGSDETLAAIAARVAPPRRLVGYGHRVSVALLGPRAHAGAALAEAAAGLALDVALFDQLGCLSPVALFALGAPAPLAAPILEAVAGAMARAEARWPRGHVGPQAAASLAHERAEAELRAAAGQEVALRGDPEQRWTVVAEADAQRRPAPLHRFLRIHPVADVGALLAALRPLGPRLAAVGVAGLSDSEIVALAPALAGLGASRLCPLGSMQAPPLDWCHDGQGVLLPLARLTDLEPLPGA
jgi:acyl-CoA reductase-like NAD-dependent aldehyde dehydrogenase